jgi:mannonate dehydratase
MKLGLGLYRHMLNDSYAFAVQAGCTHFIVHLVDCFRQGEANPSQNQPTGGKDKPWGVAGDPDKLWTANELIQLRKQVEAAGLKLEAIENFDPAPGTTFCSTAPSAPCTFATSTPF